MESGGSEQPATGPCSEPEESSDPIYFRSILVLYFYQDCSLASVVFWMPGSRPGTLYVKKLSNVKIKQHETGLVLKCPCQK
jgi:hypothetical protein